MRRRFILSGGALYLRNGALNQQNHGVLWRFFLLLNRIKSGAKPWREFLVLLRARTPPVEV